MSFTGTGKMRTNYRQGDSNEWGGALLGSAIVAGSVLPAAAGGIGGASYYGGGLIMGSFAGSTSTPGFIQLSALGAISQMYGTGNLGVNTSGYKIIPFAFLDFSGDGASNTVFYTLSATQALASNDSVVIVIPKKQQAGSGPVTSASVVSVHFIYFALIVSAPG